MEEMTGIYIGFFMLLAWSVFKRPEEWDWLGIVLSLIAAMQLMIFTKL